MIAAADETHDPQLRSWVESANDAGCDFPIQNLPFGYFDAGAGVRPGAAIGNQIIDLVACRLAELDTPLVELAQLRPRLSRWLREGARQRTTLRDALIPMRRAKLLARVPDNYTDFYASIHHATRVGRLFRPDSPLMPNYKYVPIAYHGRASSVMASGTGVRRPWGQLKAPDAAAPRFGPTKRLDYELELGFVMGRRNEIGAPVPLRDAEDHLFGVRLLNDWSARDIQAWEYQPLGPFLGKSFATSVSPWVVTMEALAPFRTPAAPRAENDPAPLPYLASDENARRGGIDITLEVLLTSARMREARLEPMRLSIGSFRDSWWTVAQMITHHTSNGCNLQPGDLLGSGTVSGADASSGGCLLELTDGGKNPIELPSGEHRMFLDDGDEVILRGWCERIPFRRIGLGECRGVVLPAVEYPE
ncbi:MAG TPA: fumarylacetoacetase [Bryobacteraceae bacterium]|nr:fumarylacetoacetase [Bryobacteraceae bacterium]